MKVPLTISRTNSHKREGINDMLVCVLVPWSGSAVCKWVGGRRRIDFELRPDAQIGGG